MAISITGGVQTRRAGSFQSNQTATQTTATDLVTLSANLDVYHLGVGTATGFGVNRFLLATTSAIEGEECAVLTTGTGEAKLVLTGTATGALTFGADGDLALLKYMNGNWHVLLNNAATLATATGTA